MPHFWRRSQLTISDGDLSNVNLPRFACALVLVLLAAPGFAQEPSATVPASGQSQRRWNPDPEKVHDPSTILTIGGVSRCFATGGGVMLLREDSTGKWLPEGRIFPEGKFPAWHNDLVPGNRGYLWAPDVIQLSDRFLVYYSVSFERCGLGRCRQSACRVSRRR